MPAGPQASEEYTNGLIKSQQREIERLRAQVRRLAAERDALTSKVRAERDTAIHDLQRAKREIQQSSPSPTPTQVTYPEGTTSSTPCLIQLGRYGDIMNALPIARDIWLSGGVKPVFVIAKEFSDLLDGVGYVAPLVLNGGCFEINKAIDLAKSMFGRVAVSQVYGFHYSPKHQCQHYNMESWRLAGYLERWGDKTMELQFDRRDSVRESELLSKLGMARDGKAVLVHLGGISSRFAEAPLFLRDLLAQLDGKVQVVDVTHIKSGRLFDMLAPIEAAKLLIVNDTSILHLAAATKTKVVGILSNVNEWRMSEPRCNCVLKFKQGDWRNHINNVAELCRGEPSIVPEVNEAAVSRKLAVVIPYHSRDRMAAIKLLKWMAELDGIRGDRTCVLVSTSTCSDAEHTEVERTAKEAFGNVVLATERKDRELGWPQGCNRVFQYAIRKLPEIINQPFLLFEPDGAPLCPKWLEALEDEYFACGKPFLGTGEIHPSHLNGFAIYPADPKRFFPDWTAPMGKAWDMVGGEFVLAKAKISRLIQHVWSVDGRPMSKPYSFPTAEAVKKLVRSDAAVFHRCKDGTLIDRLREMKNGLKQPVVLGTLEAQPSHSGNGHSSQQQVSILLPVKDQDPAYLDQCWESIKAQTHTNWELVLVVDGDRAATLSKAFEMSNHPNVKLITGQGKGLAAALNLGIKECSNELIARIDADDIMARDRLKLQVADFALNPHTDCLGANHHTFGLSDSASCHYPIITMDRLIQRRWGTTHGCAMFRKSFVVSLGGYRDMPAEDLDLWFRIVENGGIMRNLPNILLEYRHHADQKSWKDQIKPVVDAMVGRYSKRLKVAFVSEYLGFGRAERWLFDAIRCTSGMASWSVLCESSCHQQTASVLHHICELTVGKVPQDLSEFDAVLFWYSKQGTSFYNVRNNRVGVVCHSSDEDPWFGPRISRTIGRDNRIVGLAVSECARRMLVKHGVKDSTVIELGIPFHHYIQPVCPRESLRKRWGMDGVVAAFIGRATEDKGFNLIYNASRHSERGVMFAIAGKCSDETLNRRHSDSIRSLSPRTIRYLGWIDDVPNLMQASDVVVMPSRYESACYTAVEAFASERPLVSTRCGYVADHDSWATIIDRSEAGVLQGLNQARALIRNRTRLEEIRELAQSRFGFPRFAEQMREFLTDLSAP